MNACSLAEIQSFETRDRMEGRGRKGFGDAREEAAREKARKRKLDIERSNTCACSIIADKMANIVRV